MPTSKAHERLSFRPSPEPTPDPSRVREGRFQAPSPDKGRVGEGFAGVERGIRGALLRARGTGRLKQRRPCRTGGVHGDGIRFLHDFSPQTPLISPLSGRKWTSHRFHPQPTVVSCDRPENLFTIPGFLAPHLFHPLPRHCEEQSDVAIQKAAWIAMGLKASQ
jgi:hypothetical protein